MATIDPVSIADATLASSQPICVPPTLPSFTSFNRRRDACFLATHPSRAGLRLEASFNRRRDACFLATYFRLRQPLGQQQFQSQTRRLLPRNASQTESIVHDLFEFQSQTRRLLPRNSA